MAHARGSKGSLTAGVPGSDDDHVEIEVLPGATTADPALSSCDPTAVTCLFADARREYPAPARARCARPVP